MPDTINQHAAISMGGKIYVTGGYGNGDYTNTLIVFDPQADTWTELASMGSARGDHTSAVIGGKLYVFGGFSHSGGRIAFVESYDPISNTWAQVSDLSSPRDEFVAVGI